MMLELLHMTQNEFDTYYKQAVEDYASELLKNGRFPDAKQAHDFAAWEYSDIFSQGLKTPGIDVYHIHVDGKKVGVIWLLREDEVGFIGDFLIDSAYRRRGYGTGALRRLDELAVLSGIKKMRLGVFKNNTAARKLYEKQGYVVIRERGADLTMEKALVDFGIDNTPMESTCCEEQVNVLKEKNLEILRGLDIPQFKNLDTLSELPGAYVNMVYKLPRENGTTGNLLDNYKTYLCCQVPINETEYYGVASDEKQIIICRYKNDDSESRVIKIIAL